MIVERDIIRETKNIKIIKKITFFRVALDITQITKNPKIQKIKCFLNNKSYFSSIRVDALKTANIPIRIRVTTDKKIQISKSINKFKNFVLNFFIICDFFDQKFKFFSSIFKI